MNNLEDILEELRIQSDLLRVAVTYAWRNYEATLALLPQDRAENLAAAHEKGIWLTRPPFDISEESE